MAVSGSINITVLVDNKAHEGLMSEHGLSVWVEAGRHRILFDTGQGSALPFNGPKLGVRLEEAESVVLSHGHYDHTGGIPCVISRNPAVKVYCHPGVAVPRYSIRPNAQPRDIQMPGESKSYLNRMAEDKLHIVTKPLLITSEIGVTGQIPRNRGFEDAGGPFFLDMEGRQADSIDDDLAMWIMSDHGLVIVMGCCHSGAINTIEYIREITGNSGVAAVIGGLHLGEASSDRLEKTCEFLKTLGLKLLVPCHCTGEAAVNRLGNALGDVVTPGFAGFRISI
jgi:7,8-dihydropterin-6-yl-methyl-4-(beta-D-ribofuranosyl)aminobenzene 5'-phosphate synthase